MKRIYVAKYKSLYKIGVSENAEKRMKQLACGCPGIICVYESPFINNSFQVERELHNKFKDYCVGGEWFSNVDFAMIKEIVEEKGDKSRLIKGNRDMAEFDLETFAGGNFSINDLKQEIKQERSENEQLEKFSLAIRGLDISNIYSDLIYEIVFGKVTEQLIRDYRPNKFESFRNYLSSDQNRKIEALTRVVVGLIGFNWKFEEIKKFVKGIVL